MQDQPSRVLGECDPRIERAIILQFLRDDHGDRWSRAELEVEISNVQPPDISHPLARLDQDGTVHISGESVSASRAVRRVDEHGLIAI